MTTARRYELAHNRLLSRYEHRQATATVIADHTAAQAGHLVEKTWARIVGLILQRPPRQQLQAGIARLFQQLYRQLSQITSQALKKIYQWGRKRTVKADGEAIDLIVPPRQKMTEALSQEDYESLLFDAPEAQRVGQVVYGGDWQARYERLSKLASPERLARQVADGVSRGESPQQIERRILPEVNNVRASARRIARTESLRVSHAAQMQAHESLGELVIGYQIRATLDQHTRPEHAFRNGRIWYKDSGVPMKQALMMEEELLPDAPNCRCFLLPILSRPEDDVPAQTITQKIAPDAVAYEEWFKGASERERKAAVGARRYSEVKRRLDRKPQWQDFISTKGELLDVNQIRSEDHNDRLKRIGAVLSMLTNQKQWMQSLLSLGTV